MIVTGIDLWSTDERSKLAALWARAAAQHLRGTPRLLAASGQLVPSRSVPLVLDWLESRARESVFFGMTREEVAGNG